MCPNIRSPFFKIPLITIFRQMNAFNTCWCSQHAVITNSILEEGHLPLWNLETVAFVSNTSLLHFSPLNQMHNCPFLGIEDHILNRNFLLGPDCKAWRFLKSYVHKSVNSFSATVDPKSNSFRLGKRHFKKGKVLIIKQEITPCVCSADSAPS